MPRLFVAIEIPEEIKERITSLNTDIPTARWVKPEHMHVTVRFIGAAVPSERLGPIKGALSSVEMRPFDLTLRGVGRFPANPDDPPRVLWVGIEAQPALQELQLNVNRALAHIGIQPGTQPFHPHITLARLDGGRPIPEADDFLAAQSDFEGGTFTVAHYVLYDSRLSSRGPRYVPEATYALEGVS